MNGGGGLKRHCLFHDGDWCTTSPTRFSSNIWRNYRPLTPHQQQEKKEKKHKISATIDGILESCLETFGYEAKSNDLAKFIEDHWVFCSIFIVFLFFFFEGNYSSFSRGITLWGNYRNFFFSFFPFLIIQFIIYDVEESPCSQRAKSVKSSFEMDAK